MPSRSPGSADSFERGAGNLLLYFAPLRVTQNVFKGDDFAHATHVVASPHFGDKISPFWCSRSHARQNADGPSLGDLLLRRLGSRGWGGLRSRGYSMGPLKKPQRKRGERRHADHSHGKPQGVAGKPLRREFAMVCRVYETLQITRNGSDYCKLNRLAETRINIDDSQR